MKNNKHTAGPWLRSVAFGVYEIVPRNISNINVICKWHHTDVSRENQSEVEANARLIAAAPEMLEALEAYTKYIQHEADSNLDEVENKMLAAIAKARGES
jgi:hypothetical protein